MAAPPASLGSPAPTEVPRPTAPARSDISYREALRRQRDVRSRAVRLLAVVAAFILLAVGWRVTDINLPQLITGAPAAQHIVLGLVTPDLVTREVTTVELTTPFRVGSESAEPSVASGQGQEKLTITPGAVQSGQQVSFEGAGFPSGSSGTLFLVFSTARDRKISDVEADASGTFHLAFAWPSSIADGDYTVRLAMNTPTGRILPSETLMLSLGKIWETVLLALMGTVFGILISIPLSFFGARNLMQGSAAGQVAYYVVRTIFNVGRSIEILILAVIMAVVVGIGPFAGVMAIVLHSIGAMGKLYSEALESIDPGPIEAVTATGASRFQTILYAVVPQVIPQFLAFTMYRWDTNVRMSTVIGLVGGGGIGFLLIQYINLLQWSQAATAIWLIAITVMAMDYASAAIRARIV